MKTTGPNPPALLAATFWRLVSAGSAGGAAAGTARTRRGARYRKPKSRALPSSRAIWAMCKQWAIAHAELNALPIDPAFARARYREAMDRTYPSRWWYRLAPVALAYWTSTPTSTERLDPPPYAYRDANNRPSTPTYPPAVPGAAPARAGGATVAQVWADGPWTWAAYDYLIPVADMPADPSHAVIDASYTISVSSDARGSRPLFSLVARLAQGVPSDPQMDASIPPVAGVYSLYTRYRIPASPAPYYNALKQDTLHTARAISTLPPVADDPPRLRLSLGPRPPFGIGYNNNTTATQTLTIPAAPTIYLPRFGATAAPYYPVDYYPLRAWCPATGRSFAPPGGPTGTAGTFGAGQSFIRWGGPGYQITDYSRQVLAAIPYSTSPPEKDIGLFACAEGYAILRELVQPDGFTITGYRADIFDHFGLSAGSRSAGMARFGLCSLDYASHMIPGRLIASAVSPGIFYWPFLAGGRSCYYRLTAGYSEWHHAAGVAWMAMADRRVYTAPLPTDADCTIGAPIYDRWTLLATLPMSVSATAYHPDGLIAFRPGLPPLILAPDGTTTAGRKAYATPNQSRYPLLFTWPAPLT